MKVWWQTKAWPWLQKNWQWVLLPIGILLVIARAFGGRKTEVVASELTGAAEAERKANEEAAAKIQEAEAERAERIAKAREEHAEELKVLTDEQRAKAEELSNDPAALNSYLKIVGKQVRK